MRCPQSPMPDSGGAQLHFSNNDIEEIPMSLGACWKLKVLHSLSAHTASLPTPIYPWSSPQKLSPRASHSRTAVDRHG